MLATSPDGHWLSSCTAADTNVLILALGLDAQQYKRYGSFDPALDAATSISESDRIFSLLWSEDSTTLAITTVEGNLYTITRYIPTPPRLHCNMMEIVCWYKAMCKLAAGYTWTRLSHKILCVNPLVHLLLCLPCYFDQFHLWFTYTSVLGMRAETQIGRQQGEKLMVINMVINRAIFAQGRSATWGVGVWQSLGEEKTLQRYVRWQCWSAVCSPHKRHCVLCQERTDWARDCFKTQGDVKRMFSAPGFCFCRIRVWPLCLLLACWRHSKLFDTLDTSKSWSTEHFTLLQVSRITKISRV